MIPRPHWVGHHGTLLARGTGSSFTSLHPPLTVSCTGCGRDYPADRFADGSTLHCACGTRVGQRIETGIGRAERPRFLADSMLGGLAHWLRVLGYDAAHAPQIADPELIRRGLAERRVVLTRDRGIPQAWWMDNLVLVDADDPLEQLQQVNGRFRLDQDRIFTRCTRCNTALHPVRVEAVEDQVPPDIRTSRKPVARCPDCDRIYWEGTHTARMRRQIGAVLA